jgi:hypothetical protein
MMARSGLLGGRMTLRSWPNLSGSSIRSQKTTKSLGRFNLCTDVGWMAGRDNQLVAQALVIALGVIVNQELSDRVACRRFAKKYQSVQTLGF